MVFLDVNKKVWIIKDLEIPVIEDIPMKDMKWFREKVKWAAEREEKGAFQPGDWSRNDFVKTLTFPCLNFHAYIKKVLFRWRRRHDIRKNKPGH